MKKTLVLMTVLFFGLSMLFVSCASMQAKPVTPTEANFQLPTITLQSFEVPQYDGYWFYGAAVKPTKGDAGDHGAPLPMSFLFSIQNPNPYPVKLDGYRFTVAFDQEFDLITVNNQDVYWIPAGKTDEVRTTTMITVRSATLSLLVTSGYKLKAKGWSVWDALERWWKGVPDLTVPVTVKEAAFTFTADGVSKVAPFTATFP
jgi:hypothetical protein